MRVVTRFSLGFALGLLPLVAVLAFVVSQVDRLAVTNRTIATAQFAAVNESAELIRQLDLLAEFLEKFAVSEDVRYIERVRESEQRADRAVTALLDPALSSEQRNEAWAFADEWRKFRRAFESAFPAHGPPVSAQGDLPSLVEQLSGLRGAAVDVVRETRATLAREAEAAAAVQSTTERMSWTVAIGAVAVSLVVFMLTFRAIHRPLSNLMDGTRALARGDFSFRIQRTGDDEFGALSKAFNLMARSIYKLLRLKSDFVSHVSHELKTPLVSIQETNQLLLDELPGPLTDKQRRLLELNKVSTRRLATMITDLLELSRAESGLRYDFDTVDLCDLVGASLGPFEARAHEREIGLAVENAATAMPVVCDPERMTQVVHNLVDNAFKHTPDGGTVRVRVRAAGDDVVPAGMRDNLSAAGAFALLEVEDSGPGIAPEERERVFERFYQAEGAKPGGVGLGLAICREIVRAHGGVVWVRDGGGGGACIAAVLPGAAPTALGEPPVREVAA